YWGKSTVYEQDGNAGSCGHWNSDSDFVAALGNAWMNHEYKGPQCGRQIEVRHVGSDYGVDGEGNSIIVTVEDTCESCDSNHVDLSIAAWNAITNDAPHGQFHIEW
ncbi:RlpA-like double-psi beta-barrel-protein domain-containing protein-containing protein, partial [Lasiosphaeria miniovina]